MKARELLLGQEAAGQCHTCDIPHRFGRDSLLVTLKVRGHRINEQPTWVLILILLDLFKNCDVN